MTDLKKRPIFLTAVAFTIFSYIMLPLLNGTMLRWFDEMSLFEPTRLFWNQTVSYPSGVLKYVGAYLTQYFYYPWLGSTILIAIWLCMAYASLKAFNLSARGLSCAAFFAPMCLLCSVVGMDEDWLTMNTLGYFFSQTVGSLTVILLFWAYRSMPWLWMRVIFIALIASAYIPLGYYAILTAGLCAVYETLSAITNRRWLRLATHVVGIVVAVIVPQICFNNIGGMSADNDALYLKGLPEFSLDEHETWLRILFILIALSFTAGSALVALTPKSAYVAKVRDIRTLVCCAVLAAVGVSSVMASASTDRRIKCAIEMLHYIDYGQWNDALDVVNNADVEPDFNMMILGNLARKRLGLPLVYGIQRPTFDVESTDLRREGITTNVFLNVPVNYHLGKVNNSYRWSMEHTVKFGKRVFFLKYMVRAALVNKDFKLAQRYNDILLSTTFHRKWAEHFQMFIDRPELMVRSSEFAGIPDFRPDTIFLR